MAAPRRDLVSMAGGKEDHTFASYIEQRQNPNCRQLVVMHPKLLRPDFCRHCWRWSRPEELWPARSAMTGTPHAVVVEDGALASPRIVRLPEPVGELALEGRSCVRCAREICDRTRYLRDAAPAGRGQDTPLHQAAMSGNLAMLCHLITLVGEEGGHGHAQALAAQALRKKNDREDTALHVAIRMGDRDMVELMLWVDPQLVQISCKDGASPIYLAVFQGRKDIAEALHSVPGFCPVLSSYSGPRGQNALHAAVRQGEEWTKQVLSWNIDLARQQDDNRSTPLHFAVSVDQRPCFRLWIGPFLIYRYTWLRNVPTWHLLYTDPSMAYREDDQGLFPVHIAAMTNEHVAVRILLLRCPGCMGLRDKQGRTFLHVAVQNKAFGVVREACNSKKCAPIMNIQDNNGNTALHLAADVQNLGMVFSLLRNKDVSINLRNIKGETALDVAKSRIRPGFFFAGNPDKEIYKTLVTVGAKHGNYNWDRLLENRIPQPEPQTDDDDDKKLKKEDAKKEAEKEESDKLTSSTQTLGLGSVLIATVTFGASFTLPGGNIADDHDNGGSPTLAGKWYFDAFMVANTLAFICSSMATLGIMYSGMAMVALPFRIGHFLISLFLAYSSVTCLTAAFALGVYMVLAPVARSTAIAICAITPLVLIFRNIQRLWRFVLVSGALYRRRGFWFWLMKTVRDVFFRLILELWPFVVIFGWAGHLRERRRG